MCGLLRPYANLVKQAWDRRLQDELAIAQSDETIPRKLGALALKGIPLGVPPSQPWRNMLWGFSNSTSGDAWKAIFGNLEFNLFHFAGNYVNLVFGTALAGAVTSRPSLAFVSLAASTAATVTPSQRMDIRYIPIGGMCISERVAAIVGSKLALLLLTCLTTGGRAGYKWALAFVLGHAAVASTSAGDVVEHYAAVIRRSWARRYAPKWRPPLGDPKDENFYETACDELRDLVYEGTPLGVQPSQPWKKMLWGCANRDWTNAKAAFLTNFKLNLSHFTGNYVNLVFAGSLLGAAGRRPLLMLMNLVPLGAAIVAPHCLVERLDGFTTNVGFQWARFTAIFVLKFGMLAVLSLTRGGRFGFQLALGSVLAHAAALRWNQLQIDLDEVIQEVERTSEAAVKLQFLMDEVQKAGTNDSMFHRAMTVYIKTQVKAGLMDLEQASVDAGAAPVAIALHSAQASLKDIQKRLDSYKRSCTDVQNEPSDDAGVAQLAVAISQAEHLLKGRQAAEDALGTALEGDDAEMLQSAREEGVRCDIDPELLEQAERQLKTLRLSAAERARQEAEAQEAERQRIRRLAEEHEAAMRKAAEQAQDQRSLEMSLKELEQTCNLEAALFDAQQQTAAMFRLSAAERAGQEAEAREVEHQRVRRVAEEREAAMRKAAEQTRDQRSLEMSLTDLGQTSNPGATLLDAQQQNALTLRLSAAECAGQEDAQEAKCQRDGRPAEEHEAAMRKATDQVDDQKRPEMLLKEPEQTSEPEAALFEAQQQKAAPALDVEQSPPEDRMQVRLERVQARLEQVQALFDKTFQDRPDRAISTHKPCQLEVLQVYQIPGGNQNTAAYREFAQTKHSLAQDALQDPVPFFQIATDGLPVSGVIEDMDANINEKLMFHGTAPSVAKAILYSRVRVPESGDVKHGSLYGLGAHFAESVSKADQYATANDEGVYPMILSRVALGRPCVLGVETMAEAFPDDSMKHSLKQNCIPPKSHCCVVGDRRNPKVRLTRGGGYFHYREFITYDASQSVPELLIFYKRRKEHVPQYERKQVAVVNESEMFSRLQASNAMQGVLAASLAWTNPVDLDLHIRITTPSGRHHHIYYRDMRPNGANGYLDVDMQTEPNAVENIFFTEPPAGNYVVFVHYYGGGAPENFDLHIRRKDKYPLHIRGEAQYVGQVISCFQFKVGEQGQVSDVKRVNTEMREEWLEECVQTPLEQNRIESPNLVCDESSLLS